MGILKKIFSINDKSTSNEEFYNISAIDAYNGDGVEGSKMILLEPRAYSESNQIADYLKNRNSVVVGLKRVTPDQGKRIVDFIGGVIYAIGGELQKLDDGIFLCTPKNIRVQGKMEDEEESSKTRKKGVNEDF